MYVCKYISSIVYVYIYIYIYIYTYRITNAFFVRYVCVNIDSLDTTIYTQYISIKKDSKQRCGYGPVVHPTCWFNQQYLLNNAKTCCPLLGIATHNLGSFASLVGCPMSACSHVQWKIYEPEPNWIEVSSRTGCTTKQLLNRSHLLDPSP